MRLGWLLLLFPSAAFAIAGCPVGVQLGNVTIATRLPVCLKFDSSQLGGCLVDCKGVCVELPLANTKGPVETTGTACSITENGSGNGDSDGSGNTPAEGGSSGNGGLPKNWDFFNPVLGDATGTSVSATIAKLNKNLGQHIGAFSENTDKIYQRVNELTGDSRRILNASEAAQQSLREIAEYNRVAGYKLEGFGLYLSRMEPLLKEISINTANSGSSGGVPSSVASDVAGISSMMGASLNMMSSIQGNTNGLNNKLDDISGNTKATSYFAKDMKDSLKNIERSLGGGGSGSDGGSSAWTSSDVASLVESAGTTANQSEQQKYILQDMRTALEIMAEKLGNGGNGDGNGDGNGSGSSIDYSKLPGSSDNPLSVKEAKYSSYCSGENCFFDIAATQKTLDDAKKSLSDKQSDISKEVQDIFAFQLSGSAGAIDCFDLFSHNGKNYQVCPPSKEYWATLAAMMMFIFYFIALLVIFRR